MEWHDVSDTGLNIVDAMQCLEVAELERRETLNQFTGLNPQEQAALQLIVEAEPGKFVSSTDIAVILNMRSASVTILVDRLESRGLIRRIPSPASPASFHVEPTDAGVAVSNVTHEALSESLEVINSVSAPDAAIITKFLRRLTDTLVPA